MQIKATLKYFLPIKFVKFDFYVNTQCCQDSKQMVAILHCWQEYN